MTRFLFLCFIVNPLIEHKNYREKKGGERGVDTDDDKSPLVASIHV